MKTRRSMFVTLALAAAAVAGASSAGAQTLGTFRWNTAPYCNVLVLTVTRMPNGSLALDGYDEQCGGNPRQPVSGTGVFQPNGAVTFGLTIIHQPGGVQPVGLRATIDTGTLGGAWQDGAGSNGTLVFAPGAVSGGPRPNLAAPFQPPPSLVLMPQGSFATVRGNGSDVIPASGLGTRMMFWAERGAFRAGQVSGDHWDTDKVGVFSAAFGNDTIASGPFSFAAGVETSALGISATALGFRAHARHDGAFVFGDRTQAGALASTAPHQFRVRASGGSWLYSNAAMTAGVTLAPGSGTWTNLSDANRKENFLDLDGDAVLRKLAAMPIREWNYTTQAATVRHVGPTAQDFHGAFGLGDDPLGITTVDGIGIALRAVQALEARTRALGEINQALQRDNAELRARLDALERPRPQ